MLNNGVRKSVLAVILFVFIGIMTLPVASMVVPNTEAGVSIVRAEATEILLKNVLHGTIEGKWVYSYPDQVPAGTVLNTWFGSISLPQQEGWLFFIDDMPMENWAHPCRYVFVNSRGVLNVYDAYGPPENLMNWVKLTSYPGTSNQTFPVTTPTELTSSTTPEPSHTSNQTFPVTTPTELTSSATPEPSHTSPISNHQTPGFYGMVAIPGLLIGIFCFLLRK